MGFIIIHFCPCQETAIGNIFEDFADGLVGDVLIKELRVISRTHIKKCRHAGGLCVLFLVQADTDRLMPGSLLCQPTYQTEVQVSK